MLEGDSVLVLFVFSAFELVEGLLDSGFGFLCLLVSISVAVCFYDYFLGIFVVFCLFIFVCVNVWEKEKGSLSCLFTTSTCCPFWCFGILYCFYLW